MSQFTIPYKGLGIGIRAYKYDIGPDFFGEFEDSAIKQGKFDITVQLDKRSDHCILVFDIDGHTRTTCDRCLAEIDLPVKGEYRLILKFSEQDQVESDDEIIFMHPDTSTIKLAQYIYEYIHLCLPIVNTFDCNPEVDCDLKVLDRMEEEEGDDENNDSNDIWDSLKNLKLDK